MTREILSSICLLSNIVLSTCLTARGGLNDVDTCPWDWICIYYFKIWNEKQIVKDYRKRKIWANKFYSSCLAMVLVAILVCPVLKGQLVYVQVNYFALFQWKEKSNINSRKLGSGKSTTIILISFHWNVSAHYLQKPTQLQRNKRNSVYPESKRWPLVKIWKWTWLFALY